MFILLIDDGSADSSLAICTRLADADARIKVYHKPYDAVPYGRIYADLIIAVYRKALEKHRQEQVLPYLRPLKHVINQRSAANAPELSIITPVYNGEHYIENTVRSVLNSSWHDLEILHLLICD